MRSVQNGKHDREPRERGEDDVPPDQRRGRADHRPEQRAEDGCAHGGPDHLAAALARRGGEQPREGARPREAAADALQEAGAGERPEAVGEREAEAREAHQRQADEDGAPRPEPCGRGSARQSADERAGRVRGDEHADPRLREAERVLEVGEERRERRVEHRVHPDERADEEQQAAHCHAA